VLPTDISFGCGFPVASVLATISAAKLGVGGKVKFHTVRVTGTSRALAPSAVTR
jgi:hypothetical protein